MTKPDQSKAVPIPALLVFGKPTSPDLPQVAWFRIEDRASVTAAAQTLKFTVIDIATEADRALLLCVHEGVLKGSGRMIVGSVAPDVYRRIEDHAAAAAPSAAGHAEAASSDASKSGSDGTKSEQEQITNKVDSGIAAPSTAQLIPPSPTASADQVDAGDSNATSRQTTGAKPTSPQPAKVDDKRALTPSPAKAAPLAPDAKSEHPLAESAIAPKSFAAAARDPWNGLKIGSQVVAKYWGDDGEPLGWWLAIITDIDKDGFVVRWPDEPTTPLLKLERKHIAILHPSYDVAREWDRKR